MARFESALLETASHRSNRIFAWVVLPNHYHLLLYSAEVLAFMKDLSRLHGRTVYHWNGEDETRGRRVFCGSPETVMKSKRHFHATLNYMHHNPVRHGYVARWQDWPFSSAVLDLRTNGRAEVERRWHEYPIDRYGDSWDPPEL